MRQDIRENIIPDTANFSGDTIQLTAGENLVIYDVCYIKSDGKLWKANATDNTKMPTLYMATSTISANATGTFFEKGYVTNSSWTWTVGATAGVLYASTTAGAMTQTSPTTVGNIVQNIGIAESATVIRFNPSPNFITYQ